MFSLLKNEFSQLKGLHQGNPFGGKPFFSNGQAFFRLM